VGTCEIRPQYPTFPVGYKKAPFVDKKFEKIFSIEQIGYLISLKAIKLISKVKEINNNITEEFYILGDISNVKLTKKQQIIVDYLSKNEKIKKSDVKEILNIGPTVTKKLLESLT